MNRHRSVAAPPLVRSRLPSLAAVIVLFTGGALAPGLAHPAFAQEGVPEAAREDYVAGDYQVFTEDGEPATLNDVVAAMRDHEVVFVGETHDDPTGHMLEAELLRRAFEAYGGADATEPGGDPHDAAPGPGDAEDPDTRPVVLSLEFFERDVQLVLDEYLAGLITEGAFRSESRPWERYGTDYRPMIEFAKAHGVEVVAANAPRRYVTRVTRDGRAALDALSPMALATLAPLPYGEPSDAYRDQWIQRMGEVMEQVGKKCGVPIEELPEGAEGGPAPPPPGSHSAMGNQLQAQALWDATMAYWVNDALLRRPDALVLHMVGSFHVERGTGIPEQLERYRPGASDMIVVLRPVKNVKTFEPAPGGTWGDFVIQTDQSRTLEEIECRQLLGDRYPG
jgi:uncharacterized iron-regulated protein